MPVCLHVRMVNTQNGTTIDRTFDRSPVRIGRSPINELPVEAPFVSQFHAVLEFDGQRVVLWDLGSLNGTALRATGRMQPNTPVDLTSHNFEFAIVSMLFQLRFVNAVPEKPQVKREGLLLSMDAAAMQKMLQDEAGTPGPAPAGPDRTAEALQKLQPAYKAYREAWEKLQSDLVGALEPLEPAARQRLLAQVRTSMSAVQNEADFDPISAKFGKPPSGTRELVQTMTGKDFAMQALLDIAAGYLPQKGPLKDRLELIVFAQKLQDLLAVFFKCFIALRDGHQQFKMQMDIREARHGNEQQMSAARAVHTARDPRELGARLLDWSNPSMEGARAIESAFAEVMVHHVALLNGVTGGVRSLLAKLAPAAIEAELDNPRRKAASGSRLGPWRYKTLWQVFTEIYGDFAEDEKQAFALIFGADFANAYRELAEEAAPEGPPSAFMSPT
ncbi:MAG TPA: type VI secretion system-associated FHA domain protein [Polyangiaceae bacterium]